jgi:uncharacterized protein with von Willebrand factor type A (vWA) domain
MITAVTSFVEELRAVGIPVSLVEAIDGAAALRHVDLADREALRAALGATLVKNSRHAPAFDAAFDVFFGLTPASEADQPETSHAGDEGRGGQDGGAGGDGAADLVDALIAALASGDRDALRRVVRQAVRRFGGIEPGRPVGGRYYSSRVMRQLNADRLVGLLSDAIAAGDGVGEAPVADTAFERRLTDRRIERLMEELRVALRDEIRQRLVADRGAGAVARTVRVPLVEDIDLMHATRDELDRIERAVAPLARKLATRLAARRKRGSRGRLDLRRTIRRSLAHGGALLEPQFRPPRRSKPELVLLCDVSGSMATFAGFAMQLTYAIGSSFSKVRSFAFIDGTDEVTRFFGPDTDFHEGMVRMSREADLVRRDGHSDYGRSFAEFADRFPAAVTPRSIVLVTGDARNNYRDASLESVEAVSGRARGLFWLNPEARRYWDTGDSIMSTYAPVCDVIDQVRTLRQLEAFVEKIALPVHRPVVRGFGELAGTGSYW